MLAKLLKLHLRLIRRNLHMGEIFGKATAVKFVLLIQQLAFREDHQTLRLGLKTLQGLFDLWQRGGWQVEQRLAVTEQVGEFCRRQMVTAYTEGRLYDGDGKGLATIAEIGHVTAFRLEQFFGGIFTIGCNETVEVILHFFKMRLAVPEGVVGIKGDYTNVTHHFFWQCGHIPFII